MNNSNVAKEFSQGAQKGKGSNLFIEDNTIYSYGHHFPIAIRLTDNDGGYKYIWNTNKYSPTTSRHQSCVLSAIGENNILIRGDTNLLKSIIGKGILTIKELLLENIKEIK